jgi:hypothetical protein
MDVAAKNLVQFVRLLIIFWLSNLTKQSPKAGIQREESPAVKVNSLKKPFTSSLLSVSDDDH